MTQRRLELLQWTGLLLGALVWAAQHVIGFGVTEAACGAGLHAGANNDVWQAVLMGVAVVLILLAECAAVAVFLGTRQTSYEGEPPPGRIRFFAIAAMAANAFFLVIVLLDGVASIVNLECRQG